MSDCAAKAPASRAKIIASLRKTQEWLEANPHIDWMTGFYQYANRLAHLYFLNQIAGLNAYLISLYFVCDTTHKPTNLDNWHAALELQKSLMGLSEQKLHGYLIEMFFHIDEIEKGGEQEAVQI